MGKFIFCAVRCLCEFTHNRLKLSTNKSVISKVAGSRLEICFKKLFRDTGLEKYELLLSKATLSLNNNFINKSDKF